MITKIQQPASRVQRAIRFAPILAIVFFSIAIGFVISCSTESKPSFNIVRFYGEGTYHNFSTSQFGYVNEADSINPTALLLREGDLIALDFEIIYYNDPKVFSYRLSKKDGILYNGNKVISIHFSNELKDWHEQLDTLDLSALTSLSFDGNFTYDIFGYLEKIAKRKENIGLNLENAGIYKDAIVRFFNPNCLILGDISMSEIKKLSPLKNLELLMLSITDSLIDDKLPAYPNLKHLFLTDLKDKVHISIDFLGNNRQIQSFISSENSIDNYDFLRPLENLNSLSIMSKDSVPDIRFIKDLPYLDRLSIMPQDYVNWKEFTGISNLKWVVINGDISQTDFNYMVSKNKNLEVIELIRCDSIQNYETLLQLKRLKAFAVSDTLQDWQTPLKMSRLNYLSLPVSTLQDSVYSAKLQEALPDCIIVPNEGFCMGSGWMILFLPFVLFAAWIRRIVF